jgi:hypothetical protein
MDDSLIARIDAFLEACGQSASAFGREAVGDPNFVRDLRAGREPKRRLVEKVTSYMRERQVIA